MEIGIDFSCQYFNVENAVFTWWEIYKKHRIFVSEREIRYVYIGNSTIDN